MATTAAPTTVTTSTRGIPRLVGLDVARSVAVLGMIVVNVGPHVLDGPTSLAIRSAYGRASILFVVLAGIGITLLLRRRTVDVAPAVSIAWRGGLLVVLGLALQLLPHDANVILPLYGLLFFAALALHRLPSVWLWRLMAFWMVAGPAGWIALRSGGEPERDPAAFGDSLELALSAIMVTGPYPLIVWAAPFVLGMAVGRLHLGRRAVQRALIAWGAVAAVSGLALAELLTAAFGERNTAVVDARWALTAYGHSQSPLWLISASGAALLIIGALLMVVPASGRLSTILAAVGRMPLTVYVGHLLVLALLLPTASGSTARGLSLSALIFAGFLGLALVWDRHLGRGPLERLLRLPWAGARWPQLSTSRGLAVDQQDAGHGARRGHRRYAVTALGAAALIIGGVIAFAACSTVDDDSPPSASPGLTPSADEAPVPEVTAPSPSLPPAPLLDQQGVSAGHPLAAQAGENILAAGGNAVDAAIAAAFAVSVVEPFASGIGGGGSAIVAGPESDPAFYDYREVVANDGVVPSSGTGIPGFVAGMGRLHQDHGQLEWSQVLEPAYDLASQGAPVSDFLAARIASSGGQSAVGDLPQFAPGGQLLGAGDSLVQEDLAATLATLRDDGWQDFYTGSLAGSLANATTGVDAGSLADYAVVESEPVSGRFGEYELLGAAPSLPGAAMIQMLQIAETNGIADMAPNSPDYIDTLSEAWLIAEDTVFTDIGDPAFVDVPTDRITDWDVNSGIDLAASVTSSDWTSGVEDAPNTTHVSVVDEDGFAVSMTNTIMFFWGSGQEIDGYFLNNHLSRFDAIDTAANQPAPGRRTTTWSNPGLVLDADGRPELAIGSPGGHQILPIMGTVLVQWGLQGRDLEESLLTPRFRAAGSTMYLEEGHSQETTTELRNRGWSTEVWAESLASFGSVQPIEVDYESGSVASADDPRREGAHRILD